MHRIPIVVEILSERVVGRSNLASIDKIRNKMSFVNLRLGRVNNRLECRDDLLRFVRTEDSSASYYDIAS